LSPHFLLEPGRQRGITFELYRLHESHEVPVVVVVGVVVSKDTPIVPAPKSEGLCMYARLYLTTSPSEFCHTSSLSIAPRLGRLKQNVSLIVFSILDGLGTPFFTKSSMPQVGSCDAHLDWNSHGARLKERAP